MKKTVYIISGPLGVGKTAVAKALSQSNERRKYIEGDAFFRETESDTSLDWDQRLNAAWRQILDQTIYEINNGYDVVIDFVVENELDWLRNSLKKFKVNINYYVLIADRDVIKNQLMKRDGNLRYWERSRTLLDQLVSEPKNKDHLIDTTNLDIDAVVEFITQT